MPIAITGPEEMTGGAPPQHDAPSRTVAAVSVRGVSKAFRLPTHQVSTLKERALHPLRRIAYDELRALDDISIEVADGEFFGIVGRNGSGKSTLLKCIAGIYGADRGTISVAGRLSPFIELGVGFNMDLAARDNVIINAIMVGMGRREAAARFDEVIAFAELEEFVDLKLKNYSSGMLVRLAFASAIQVDADVLLIDEVLAVGDAAFQQKCFDEFARLKREGRTIVFVSHDMALVERFCDRAMLLERGAMVMLGDPHEIGRAYHKINFGYLPHRPPKGSDAPGERGAPGGADTAAGGDTQAGAGAGERVSVTAGDAATLIVDAWFENAAGERVTDLSQQEPVAMCFEALLGEDLEDPVFAATLRTHLGHTIVVARSDLHGEPSGSFCARERVLARFLLPNWLTSSRYTLTPSIARAGTGADALALVEDMASIMIHGNASGGILEAPIETTLEHR